MNSTDFIPDKNRIWLCKDSVEENKNENFYYLNITTDDPDEDENEEFNNFAFDIISSLSDGHAVLYSASYKKIKSESKKWFGRGWRPAKFNSNGATSKLKQHLVDTKWNNGIYADLLDYREYKVLCCKERHYDKELYILQEKLDMSLFHKTDMTYTDECTAGVVILIFSEAKIEHKSSDEDTIDFYRKKDDFIMKISADIIFPRVYISLNKNYMSMSVLTQKIIKIAEKHNKFLEVEI